MKEDIFVNHLSHFKEIASDCIKLAKKNGAEEVEVDVSESLGKGVATRNCKLESIEQNREKSLTVSVLKNKKKGSASSSDLSPSSIKDTIEKAISICNYTASDEFNGLPNASLFPKKEVELSLFHPWEIDLSKAEKIAIECENTALNYSKKIKQSEGAAVNSNYSQFIFANSSGFIGGYGSSVHSLSCSVLAEENNNKERDYWWSSARDSNDLLSPLQVGEKASHRSLRRLNSRKISSKKVPVIFESNLSSSLISSFIAAISGGNLYKKQSFLLDSLNKEIFPTHLNIFDDPFIEKGISSCYFDAEGVETKKRTIVENGILKDYFLSNYSAKKLNLLTTGNAGGSHNIIVSSTGQTFDQLVKELNTGLIVTEILGHGTNMVTGDYSRGAAGLWVENGEILYPVSEITVASNLKDIFKKIVSIGNDFIPNTSKKCGSMLIEEMTIAGA